MGMPRKLFHKSAIRLIHKGDFFLRQRQFKCGDRRRRHIVACGVDSGQESPKLSEKVDRDPRPHNHNREGQPEEDANPKQSQLRLLISHGTTFNSTTSAMISCFRMCSRRAVCACASVK